jgi:beta-xylosidase
MNIVTTIYDCGKKLERPEQEWAVLEKFKNKVGIKKELKKQIGKRECDVCQLKKFCVKITELAKHSIPVLKPALKTSLLVKKVTELSEHVY